MVEIKVCRGDIESLNFDPSCDRKVRRIVECLSVSLWSPLGPFRSVRCRSGWVDAGGPGGSV